MNSKITDRDIDPAINPHANTVGGMVRTTILIVFRRTHIGNQDLTLPVGNSIPILVLEDREIHGLQDAGAFRDHSVQDIQLRPHGDEAPRIVDLGVDRMGLRRSISIGIHQTHDPALPGPLPEGTKQIDSHEHFASRRGAETSGTRSDIRPGEFE